MVMEFYRSVEVLREYWDVWKEALPEKDATLWKNFQSLSDSAQTVILDSPEGERLRNIKSRVNRAKVHWRKENQEGDAFLVKFWDARPRHEQNMVDKR